MSLPDRQDAGAIAAIIAAATFVFGFALFATTLSGYTTGDPTPAESVAFLVDHQTTLYVWNSVIFIVFGIVLVPVVLSLRERLADGAPGLAAAATAFGLIWAGLVIAAGMIANVGVGTIADLQAADPAAAQTAWSALDAVQNGLGGGNEITGGIWIVLVSAAALRTNALPRALSVVGVGAGVAGIATLIPAFEPVGAVFGLGLIAWFAWAGVFMLTGDSPAAERADGLGAPETA